MPQKFMNFELRELSRKLGRRAFRRFAIPGTSVSWKLYGAEAFSETGLPLSDLSRGGFSFLANELPPLGSEISVQIVLPQIKEALEVLGRVIYAIPRGPRLTYRYRVGVEMISFAASAGANSSPSSEIIEAFEQKYGKRR